jgi:hypothetical protein
MGGRSLQNPKIKYEIWLGQQNPLYLANCKLLGENKDTTSINPWKWGVCHLETLKFYKNKSCTFIFFALLKFSHPSYLANGEQLRKKNTSRQSKPLKMGAFVTSNSRNKNSNLVGTPLKP